MLIEKENKMNKIITEEQITKEKEIKDYLLTVFKKIKKDSWKLIDRFEDIIDHFTDLCAGEKGSLFARQKGSLRPRDVKIDYDRLTKNIMDIARVLNVLLENLKKELCKKQDWLCYRLWT